MKIKLVLKVLIAFILLGCIQANKNEIYLTFDNNTRKLNVELISSAFYLTKIDTKIKHDTLELFVYEAPIFLTFKEEKKKGSRIINVDKSIHFIKHHEIIYPITSIRNPK